MEPTPATMFFTKSSCPGTSTIPTWNEEAEAGRRQVQVGEAEVDRDTARLLFRQAIGVGAGQRLDQRALAVIDVAGGGDDEMLRRRTSRSLFADTARSALITSRVLPRKDRPQIELDGCRARRSRSPESAAREGGAASRLGSERGVGHDRA